MSPIGRGTTGFANIRSKQLDRAVAVFHQGGESGVAIDLQLAMEAREMFGGMLALAVPAVDVGGGRMPRAFPGPRVDRVTPRPPSLGPAATGIRALAGWCHQRSYAYVPWLGKGRSPHDEVELACPSDGRKWMMRCLRPSPGAMARATN